MITTVCDRDIPFRTALLKRVLDKALTKQNNLLIIINNKQRISSEADRFASGNQEIYKPT